MKKFDRYIISFILIASLILILFRNFQNKDYNEKILHVYVNNDFYQEVKFNNSTNKEFTITSSLGFNKVQIKNGKVKIIDSDCREKICIKKGYIDKAGESIFCLPHNLILKITGFN